MPVTAKKKTPTSRSKTATAAKKTTGVCQGAKVVSKPSYTPAEVAEILGVGRSTIADKMSSGELKYETPFGAAAGFQKSDRKKRLPEIRRISYDELLRIAPWLKGRMTQS